MSSLNGSGESPCSMYLYTEKAYLQLLRDADMSRLSYQVSLGTFYKVILLSAAANIDTRRGPDLSEVKSIEFDCVGDLFNVIFFLNKGQ